MQNNQVPICKLSSEAVVLCRTFSFQFTSPVTAAQWRGSRCVVRPWTCHGVTVPGSVSDWLFDLAPFPAKKLYKVRLWHCMPPW